MRRKRRWSTQNSENKVDIQTLVVFSFLLSLSFFSVLALAIAVNLCCWRTATLWFRLAAMAAISAPTIPRWCFTVLRDRFLATSSVIPFLCMRRYDTVQAILRGFLRCRKREAFLELSNRNVYNGVVTWYADANERWFIPCCRLGQTACPCLDKFCNQKSYRCLVSTFKVTSSNDHNKRSEISRTI